MKSKPLPTVDELNEAQREWMKLDPGAPRKELDRVYALVERLPKRYVTGHDGQGICMIDGAPMSARPRPFADVLAQCQKHGGRTDVAWNGSKGEWYAL